MKKRFRDLSLDESKQIMIQLLDFFVSFCEHYNLAYSLTAGTLLGAIRHNGFIPWDDDIDVMMPRHDYNIFLKHFPSWSKKTNVGLVTPKSKGFYMMFSKIICKDTILIQSNRTEKIGVWIDVFPVDYVLNEPYDAYANMVLYANELYYLGSSNFLINYSDVIGYKKLFSFFKNIKRIVVRHIKKRHFLKAHFAFIKKHKGNKSMCFYFPKVIKIWSQISNVSFDNLDEAVFEGKRYKIINNWDEYLRIHYGDYLIIPPIKERAIHLCQLRKIKE